MSSNRKGKLLEDIVALMHTLPNIKVEKRKWLPPIRQGSGVADGGGGEIDVLITSSVDCYPVRIAFECKNWGKPISGKEISEFAAKLDYVGIPRQFGIFVSLKGYTKNAVSRANDAGIRLLIASGITKDRLSLEIREAITSVVYLLANVEEFNLSSDCPPESGSSELLLFKDEKGNPCGTVGHLIWIAWLNGEIPLELGSHPLPIKIPPGWHQVVNGVPYKCHKIMAIVRVMGLTATRKGKSSQVALVDYITGKPQKAHFEVRFPKPPSRSLFKQVLTEDELKQSLEHTGIKFIHRLRLPRIICGPMFWPPSQKATERFMGLVTSQIDQKNDEVIIPTFEEIEGIGISAAWDKIG
jgi:hypothetical protein